MKAANPLKIGYLAIAITLLYPGISWCINWNVILFDDFDDGNIDGWITENPLNGNPTTAPDIVPSPEGYSLRGVGSGYSNDPGLNVILMQQLSIPDAAELKIEMRDIARAGGAPARCTGSRDPAGAPCASGWRPPDVPWRSSPRPC